MPAIFILEEKIVIEIRHLTKKYGDHVAVEDLNLTVEPGKIYGFLGPNGAGKSTTMNIITGYIGATSGEVIIDGHNILTDPIEAKKCIGYLPELPPLYLEMTVSEYLTFASDIKGIDKKERKQAVLDAMERTKTLDVSKRLIKNLSKGYKQRVGLAQALINMPKVIILDEPTVGLDPKQIIEMRELIRSLGEDHTVILSSHILSEVSEVCDHVFIISHGRLVASDAVENLKKIASAGGGTLDVTAKGDEESIRPVLDALEGVESYEFNERKDDGTISFVVNIADDTDVRDELSLKLAEKSVPVLGMNLETKSLEDVFLTLTDEDESEGGQANVFGL